MMALRRKWLLVIGLLWAVIMACGMIQQGAPEEGKVLLFDNLGNFSYPITTQVSLTQQYFDQGLVLAYGFNHAEAHRSFKEAAKLDPNCAMCFWGQALVLGPNINAPMDDSAVPVAYEAIRKASQLSSVATPKEQALIQALSRRYSKEVLSNRTHLDEAYAEAMRHVWKQFPGDSTIGSLLAEALMDLHPWNYWSKVGEAYAWTPEILKTLETVLARDANHPLANHLYIHAVEASPFPERGLASADRLRDLVPGAGHLVHMPGHIYIRVGRYRDALLVNQRATEVDEGYLSHSHSEGVYPLAYVPHNHHFLWAAATKLGMSAVAFDSANDTASHVDPPMMRQPGLAATLQHFWVIPLYTQALFGKWEDILQQPRPLGDLQYPTGIWHYARGLAYTRYGQVERAEQELVQLRRIADDPGMDKMLIFELNPLSQLLHIGVEILSAELAVQREQYDQAIRHLERAIALEEGLNYTEPKDWYLPPRQVLGAVLLEAGRPSEAEKVYREDLIDHPQSGWSLFGLAQSLRAQGKAQELEEVEARFHTAWADADVTLTSSRF